MRNTRPPASHHDVIGFADQGHGYDVFGMYPPSIHSIFPLARWLHDRYFRVESHGAGRIPSGGAILAANHSGMLPIDAAILYTDILSHTGRVARPIMDLFVPRLPVIGTWFARVGGVRGTRRNVRKLLADGALLMVFPEGSPGVAKTYRERYQLRQWRVGHAELAIEHQVPVVPVAIIGAEEMWPLATRIDRVHPFGAPYLPIPAVPLPLPVKLRIWYGAPIPIPDLFAAEAAADLDAVDRAAELVCDSVADLIERGLRHRRGVFR